MLVDEGLFHRARRLPRWERIGHPLDTLTVIACYGWVLAVPDGPRAREVLAVAAVFSTLFVTKDELVHARRCSGAEHWIHALLFVLHPVTFVVLALAWPDLHRTAGGTVPLVCAIIRAQFVGMVAFAAYQILYWNLPWTRTRPPGAA
jgi:hypothetical protein